MKCDDLLKRKEPLHPELVPFVFRDMGIVWLKHPLVIEPFYDQQLNALINERYKRVKQEIERAREERNYARILIFTQRPYRLEAFADFHEELDDKRYWELLAGVWTDSENIFQNEVLWRYFLASDRPKRLCLMNAKERAAFDKLPESLTLYRGYTRADRKNGMAWTLSTKKAIWFAKRWGQKPKVVSGTTEKAGAIAYFMGRNEQEIVILPEDVKQKKVEVVA